MISFLSNKAINPSVDIQSLTLNHFYNYTPEYSDYFNKKVQNNQQRLHHSPEKNQPSDGGACCAFLLYSVYRKQEKFGGSTYE